MTGNFYPPPSFFGPRFHSLGFLPLRSSNSALTKGVPGDMMLTNLKLRFISLVVAEPNGSASFDYDWTARIDTVPGWLSRNEALLLWEISGCVQGANAIVEIGSYEGRSTIALATGSTGARVTAVDPHTGDKTEVDEGLTVDTWDRFRANLLRTGVEKLVDPVRDSSVSAAEKYNGAPVELLFIDGWHSREAVIADIQAWRAHLAPNASVVIDDWYLPEVAAGVLDSEHLLPPLAGAVGKDLVFTNSELVLELPIMRAARRRARITNPYKIMRSSSSMIEQSP